MVLADEFPVGGLDLVIACVMGDTENGIGVCQVRAHVLLTDAREIGI